MTTSITIVALHFSTAVNNRTRQAGTDDRAVVANPLTLERANRKICLRLLRVRLSPSKRTSYYERVGDQGYEGKEYPDDHNDLHRRV